MTHNAGTKIGKHEVYAIFRVDILVYQKTDSTTELIMVELADCHSKSLLSNSIYCYRAEVRLDEVLVHAHCGPVDVEH
jgi:hypothetical protein